jgi:hypothetical protein
MDDNSYKVKLSELPQELQDQIPYSILTHKDEYTLGELPYQIQYLIQEYFKYRKMVDYTGLVLDCKLEITKYGDFLVIDNYYDLVCEYFKSYLLTSVTSYPFDPFFGSRLKSYLMKRDTSLQYTLLHSEIQNIADSLSRDLSIPVVAEKIEVKKASTTGMDVTYNAVIVLKINNVLKQLNIQVPE